jgi:putative ABC transport system permease protein
VTLLALGIGVTTAFGSLAVGVLLTPPPYADPSRLVLVTPARGDGQPFRGPCTARQCGEWSKARAFADAAAYFWVFDYLVLGDGSASLEGMAVSSDYFKVIGVRPMLGRAFTSAETSAQSHPVVILGHDLWKSRFHSDPRIVGRTITLSRHRALTVIGVMPPGLRFLPAPLSEDAPNYDVNAMVDFWVPQALDRFPPDIPIFNLIARLGDGVTIDRARAEITAIAANQALAGPALANMTATAEPVQDALNRAPATLILPLFGAALCVLVIACANAAALQLARGLRRCPEMAIHAALGASRFRLAGQALVEHAVVGVLGGALGAALAYVTLSTLVASTLTGSMQSASTSAASALAAGGSLASIPRLDAVVLDLRLLAFGVAAGVLTALVSGLPELMRLLGRSAGDVSRFDRGQHSRVTSGGWRTLQTLTAAQIALTLALLAAAGLLLRSMWNAAHVTAGYQTRQILTMMVTDVGQDWQAFHARALERVNQLPGVAGAAFAWGLPLTNTGASTRVRALSASSTGITSGTTSANGTTGPSGTSDARGAGLTVPVRAVTSSFFDLLDMRLIEGRAFHDTDGPDSRPVAIVNATLAARLFPGMNPIGRRIDVPGWEGQQREIVGVMTDVRARALTQPAEPELYLPLRQATAFSKHLVVRTHGDPLTLAPAVQSALRALDPAVAIESVKTFTQIESESMASHRLAATVTAAFGVIASVLASLGIYGTLAWSMARRRRELAIRVALGADRKRVLRVVMMDAARPLIAGGAIGLGAAVLLSRALSAWLFGITPHDPLMLSAACALLLVIALIATWLPARDALHTDPNAILRSE